MGKSKRNSPKPDSNRAERLAQRRAAQEQASAVVTRPFEGLAAECDLVALREFVPSATATLKLAPGVAAEREVILATVLPGAVAALVRAGDEPVAFVGTQTQHQSDDPAAGIAAAILWTQGAEPGDSLPKPSIEGGARLADVIDPGADLELTVHNDFDWWVPEGVTPDPQVAATIEQAKQAIMPSARLNLGGDGVGAAWWVDAGEKAHVRWVRPENEDDLMLALARVHARGGLHMGEGSRFAGSFRTHGLLVPVFDLDPERHPTEWEAPAREFGARLAEALADTSPMTGEERRSRDGLRARQVTLR
ncbi:DUF5926 family protein [Nocardia camponoti]|uniref:DUF5926 domain-containing protein n=1 Tax=Nocardia camponoti TaxID=1616106 RepID=A0A917QKL1_9NOCA|nr:DUF5926 family protein [Nocardia camponoti]GGK55230.1 hypothetical protein GCM10011591_28980 [Nocardia camponoti]